MKKAILFVCLIGANLSFVACTDDSLADVQEEMETYADGDTSGGNGGEDGQIDPPQEPPAGN